jgi:hypothetical protein
MLEMNKEIVADLILRNRKSEVTNSDGQFIFRGQQSHRVPIPLSREMERFNDRLSTYLRHGYKADPYPHFTWPAKMLVRNMDF